MSVAERPIEDSQTPEAQNASRAKASGNLVAVARGLGGRVELYEKDIYFIRDGVINYLFHWLYQSAPRVDVAIPIRQVASVEIISPLFLNEFFVVEHPGSAPLTGRMLHDATVENVQMMNFFDNREFYDLKRKLEALM